MKNDKIKFEPISALMVALVFFLAPVISSDAAAGSAKRQEKAKVCSFIIEKLQKRYESTRDITAEFVQRTSVPGEQRPVTASGRVYFKRPYLMRWDYEMPEKQLIVTSGSRVYVYEPEANQVSVLSRKQFLSTRVSRAFFFGKGDIERDFKVLGCTLTRDGWVLRLEPRESTAQLKSLQLTIDREDFIVKRTVIEDQMGSRTVIEFRKIKVNTRLDPELFDFTPPKGVEIFNAG